MTRSNLAFGSIPTVSGWRNARKASAQTTFATGSPSSPIPEPIPPSFHPSNPHRSIFLSHVEQQSSDMSTNVQWRTPRLKLSKPTEPLPLNMSKCRVLHGTLPATTSSYRPKLVKVEYTASLTLPIIGRR